MDNFWKDKKVIAYIALLHHTRFIIPVMEKLEKNGATIKYVVGQAERSQEITAVECGLDYNHVFDYLSNDDFDDIHKNYLRERDAFSAALIKDFALGTQMVTVMDKTLYATAMEYVGFKNLLKTEKPDLCFSLHEVNRWGKMFAFWAKKFNTPFITLQEGLGYNLDFGYIGHVQYGTLDLVWGERIRKKFSEYEAPVERIIPVGNTHLSEEKKYQQKMNIRKKMRKKYKCSDKYAGLLIFSSKLPSLDKLSPLLEGISNNNETVLILKFHPATKHASIDQFKKKISENQKKKLFFIHGEESTYDLLSMCDVCILAQPSTTGLEALAFDKPVVQLDISTETEVPYSFVEQQVAVEMSPSEVAAAIEKKTDFKELIDQATLDWYLKNELADTDGAVERIVDVFEKTITANKNLSSTPIEDMAGNELKWSIVLQVPLKGHQLFLTQLETMAANSENSGEYEVILLEPSDCSIEINYVLDSLEGNVQRLKAEPEENMPLLMNRAAKKAVGEKLLFVPEFLTPKSTWLLRLQKAIDTYGSKKLFGAKITNQFNNIVHAGIVLNSNNAPVSAYLHLDENFPQANKERAFQMLDGFLAVDKELFADLGGFSYKTGENAFMDICLRAKELMEDPEAALYIPDVHLVQIDNPTKEINYEDSICFYGKWHGELWENEDALYEKDGISRLQLDAARMTRAMNASRA